MTERLSFKLKVPVTLKDGTTLGELSVRRPMARDLLVTDPHRGEVAKARALIAHVTGQDPKVIDQLDAKDFGALGDLVGDFPTVVEAATGEA